MKTTQQRTDTYFVLFDEVFLEASTFEYLNILKSK